MQLSDKKKVLTVGEVVDSSRRYFKNRKQSITIIRVFFEEVLKQLVAGKEVRFPKKGNGRLILAVFQTKANGIHCMEFIKSKNLKNIFKGIVKPNLSGFDVKTGGKVAADKKFGLRFSYPRRTIAKLQEIFQDDDKRAQLIEIE